MIAGTWPSDYGSPIFIRKYEGRTYEDLIQAFHDDATLLLSEGYEPTGQHYIEGEWSVFRAVVATVLLLFMVGIVLWLQMLLWRPVGTLTVTYVRRGTTR
jgi:cytochrome b subunit of formate dehydrogenase